MNKKKIGVLAAVLVAAALAALLLMPRENLPSPDSRVILEHTHRAYIAPSCFEVSDATNFIEDGTLKGAEEIGYPPINECTERAFEGNSDSFAVDFLKELGFIPKESKDW